MTEIKGNVKFVEDNNKWLWKRYDGQGSVTYRSPLFDTEREAREHYQNEDGQAPLSNPDDHEQLTPDGDHVGTATGDGEFTPPAGDHIEPNDNTAGSASL